MSQEVGGSVPSTPFALRSMLGEAAPARDVRIRDLQVYCVFSIGHDIANAVDARTLL